MLLCDLCRAENALPAKATVRATGFACPTAEVISCDLCTDCRAYLEKALRAGRGDDALTRIVAAASARRRLL
jgi:hypothetical protein